MNFTKRQVGVAVLAGLAATLIGGGCTSSTGDAVAPPTGLHYASNPATYAVGLPIPENPPAISGGPSISFAVSPALPAGLILNTTTGVITGTPTAVTARAAYTVTASNSGGSAQASLTLTVRADVLPPTGLHYATNPAVYMTTVSIPANRPIVSGGAVTSYAVSPALPAGLTLGATSGVITGTPTAVAPAATYTITASNSAGSTKAGLVVTVRADVLPPTGLHYSTNPAFYTTTVGIPANRPAASGGAVTSYAVAPALPAGLSLNTVTGVLTGIPTAVALQATYTITASNSAGSTTAGLFITVNAAVQPPSGLTYASNPATYILNSSILPNTPSSSGGPVTSYAVSPALPAGLSFNTNDGAITGIPTALSTMATYTITATNSAGSTTAGLLVAVNAPPVPKPTSLTYATNPAAYTKGMPISANVPSSGGGAVASYALTPALPAGLSLNTSNGYVTGTPSAVTGQATYTITATNAGGSASVGLTITVSASTPAPSNVFYATNPAIYTAGAPIIPNIPTAGGGPVTSYAVTPQLPPGLSFNTGSGAISGTPTGAATQANYTITANGPGGSSAPVTLPITVNPAPPTFSYSQNPAIYTAGSTITNNSPVLTSGSATSYSISSPVPAGLNFSTVTGIISGTPSALSPTTTYTVTANLTGGGTATVSVSIQVIAATSALIYSNSSPAYQLNALITSNTPTLSSGSSTSWAITPSLPTGLFFSLTTGIITGTPTVVSPPTTYTVTATLSGGGSATAALLIAVIPANAWGKIAIVENPLPPSTDSPQNLSYTAVYTSSTNPPLFSRKIRVQLIDSAGITGDTQVVINFGLDPAFPAPTNPPTFGSGGATALNCPNPVSTAAPTCDMVVNLPFATPLATYHVLVKVAGAVTTQYNAYNKIQIALAPDATPGPGTIELLTQAGNKLPLGLKAPLWVKWKKPAIIDSFTVNLNVSGAYFYSFAPGANTQIVTTTTATCNLDFDGTSASLVGCGFGLVAGPGSGTGQATVTGSVVGAKSSYTVAPLVLDVVQPLSTRRTVAFQNNSSTPLWVGITGGAGNSFLDPTSPVTSGVVTSAQLQNGAGSQCGTTNPAAACPIGTTCVQGGAGGGGAGVFQCFYDLPSLSSYALAPNSQTPITFSISGSSLSPQGMIWSGNFYGRTGCATGQCENGYCGETTPGGACSPGTGSKPGINTLAELTFQADPAPDYYDVSIINGANFAVQFAPLVPTSVAYSCGTAGSMKPSPDLSLTAATWKMNVTTSASFPPLPSGTTWPSNYDAMSYYLLVSTTTGTKQCYQQSDCTGNPSGTTCGYDIALLVNNYDATARWCGQKLAWMTANEIWGKAPALASAGAPFYFTSSPPAPTGVNPVTYGDLQMCVNYTYTPYALNEGNNPYLACGGVMWGTTQNPLPIGNYSTSPAPYNNPSGLKITTPNPGMPVQTINVNWIQYVLPTIQWLKQACPTCYTFPFDDASSTFTCDDGGGLLNYSVTFSDLDPAP